MSIAKQAFRLGFLQKCADAGMTAAQATAFAERAVELVKQAQQAKQASLPAAAAAGFNILPWLGTARTGMYDALSGLTNVASIAGPFALAVPPITGAIGGHLLAKMTDADDETIKSIHKKELIDEIRRNRQILEQKRRTYR
jgi:hypothetical protein